MRHIFVLDRRLTSGGAFDQGWGLFARQYADRSGGQEFYVDENWEMDRICRRIVHYAGTQGMGDLHICCHGIHRDGHFQIQLGRDGLTEQTASHFQQLRDHWEGPYCRIKMHVCCAASETGPQPRPRRHDLIEDLEPLMQAVTGTPEASRPGSRRPRAVAPGDAILQALANFAGVDVMAGVDTQIPDPEYNFEGPVVHYHSQNPVPSV